MWPFRRKKKTYPDQVKGHPTCPYCRSKSTRLLIKVPHREDIKIWRGQRSSTYTCSDCGREFFGHPSPSYDSRYDRYMTPSETKRAAYLAAEKQRRTPISTYRSGDDNTKGRKRRWFPTLGGFSLKRTFLILLVMACLVAAVWTGYLLFTDKINPIVGTIILLADIGVLIWNISVLKKYRVGTGNIISIFLVIVILGAIIGAFSGVKPFSTVKSELVDWFQGLHSGTSQEGPHSASEYPAEISGHVTIADKVRAATAIPVAPNKENHVFWVVDFSVRNVAYSEAMVVSAELGYKGWEIVAGGQDYVPRSAGTPESASIALGETGQFKLCFSVPNNLQVNDTRICYLGQEPYSYGKLTGGDWIEAYDWDLRKPIVGYEGPSPHGLYKTWTFFGDATLEFEDHEVTTYNFPVLRGKSIYTYRILDDGTKIQLTDVVTNEVMIWDFKYNEQYGYIVIVWGDAGSLTYWKD